MATQPSCSPSTAFRRRAALSHERALDTATTYFTRGTTMPRERASSRLARGRGGHARVASSRATPGTTSASISDRLERLRCRACRAPTLRGSRGSSGRTPLARSRGTWARRVASLSSGEIRTLLVLLGPPCRQPPSSGTAARGTFCTLTAAPPQILLGSWARARSYCAIDRRGYSGLSMRCSHGCTTCQS